MSINNTKPTKGTKNLFEDDFEVIYQEDSSDILPDNYGEDMEDDDYEDVLSTLSKLDEEEDCDNSPGLVSPASRAVRTKRRAIFRLIHLLLRPATLVLTAVITYIRRLLIR